MKDIIKALIPATINEIERHTGWPFDWSDEQHQSQLKQVMALTLHCILLDALAEYFAKQAES